MVTHNSKSDLTLVDYCLNCLWYHIELEMVRSSNPKLHNLEKKIPDENIPTSAPECVSEPFGTDEGDLNLNSVIFAFLRSVLDNSPSVLTLRWSL